MIIEVTLFLLIYSREKVLLINELYDFYMKNHMMQIVKEVSHMRKEAW